MKIVACGLSGFIGRPLVKELAARHELVCLRRKLLLSNGDVPRQVLWDPSVQGEWAREIDGADAVINLSGEPIAAKRWTKEQKKELITSRLVTTRAMVEAIASARNKPKILLNASAIGFYGDRGHSCLDENSPPGSGFLADLCKEWERQALKAREYGVRVVVLRTGIVLGSQGGALAKMLLPFRLGLGGPLGSGKQIMSWIHLEDEVAAIIYALETNSLYGPLNLTSPEPVSMTEFASALGRILKRPALMRAPAIVIKAILGEMAGLFLTGQDVRPKALLNSGFHFKFPILSEALKDAVR